MVPDFHATKCIRTIYTMVDYSVGAYNEKRIRKVEGTATIYADLPRSKSSYYFIMSLPIV